MILGLKFISLFHTLFGKGEINIKSIEKKGLLAVKIAQMYAVRSDLLSIEKCRQLQKLYENSSPIPWEEVKMVLEESAPKAFWDEVTNIDETPIAAASLGQVHRAKHIDGKDIVIKIIKPEASKDFERDLSAVRVLARIALTLYPKLKRLADPMGTIKTIARLTRTELDLRNEQKGSEILSQVKEAEPDLEHLQNLHFPHFYTHLTSERVLVSEFLPYKSVSKGLQDGSFTYAQLLNLFRTQGYFLFEQGKFHGDLHPGNIFFEGEKLWFIDNANIEVTDAHFAKGLLDFLESLGKEKFHRAAKIMEILSISAPKNYKKYYQDFQDLYAGFDSKKSSLTNQMIATVKLCVRAGLVFPEGAFPIVKSLMYLDGIALKCAPEADLLKDVLKYKEDLA